MSKLDSNDRSKDQRPPAEPPPEAPGWRAIDMALGARYPGQTPHQFTSQHPYELDRPSPLPAITVWEAPAEKKREGFSSSSWHYVSYGLTELFEKSAPDPSISGFGFELTFVLPKSENEESPPHWPLFLLQGLARNILGQRQGFDSGHCMDLGAPPDPEKSPGVQGFICVPDPELGKIRSPFGSVLFLRLVGLHPNELEIFQELSLPEKMGALAELTPDAVTVPTRTSWLDDPEKSKILKRHQLGLSFE